MKRHWPRVPSALLVCTVSACSGSIGGSAGEEDSVDDSAGQGGQGQGGDGAGGTTTLPSSCGDGAAPAPRPRIWRLSATQYATTVKQAFDVAVDVSMFPLDGVKNDTLTSFDTHADANLVNDRLGDLYNNKSREVAQALVTRLTADKSCLLEASPQPACVRAQLSGWAEKAYRRPLSDAEKDRLAGFHAKARSEFGAGNATRMALAAMMQSPHFLYRFELGEKQKDGRYRLSQHEIANQLSYLLADSPPDAALRAAADEGALTTAQDRRAHAERLLKTPAAKAKMTSFFVSHLGLKSLSDGKSKDATKFPMFDDTLRRDLIADAKSSIESRLFSGSGSLEDVLAGNLGLSAALTSVYGTGQRPGLIAHPAVLSALSNEATTSPVHRGLFYWKTLLCGDVPPPPGDAATAVERLTDPNDPDGSERVQWAYFQKSAPACAGCHSVFHPLGLGLEHYDPIGRERNKAGLDLTVSVADVGTGVDGDHEDGIAFAKAIAQSDIGRACFALQMTTFAFGRSVDIGEEGCRLAHVAGRFKGREMGVTDLLVALTEDETFVYRRAP